MRRSSAGLPQRVASTEIFELLNVRAVAWTRMHLANTSQGAVNRERLAAFLGEQAALLRFEVAGSTGLTDGTVQGTVDSLARFYGRWTPRQGLDNTSLSCVSGVARAWTKGRLAHLRTGASSAGTGPGRTVGPHPCDCGSSLRRPWARSDGSPGGERRHSRQRLLSEDAPRKAHSERRHAPSGFEGRETARPRHGTYPWPCKAYWRGRLPRPEQSTKSCPL